MKREREREREREATRVAEREPSLFRKLHVNFLKIFVGSAISDCLGLVYFFLFDLRTHAWFFLSSFDLI
jgi:hypothetical protein